MNEHTKLHTDPDLLLVDGSSYLYRAYHALPPLTNSRGEATGAVYGVTNMLRTLLKTYQPAHLAVVFDAKGKTFRDDLFAQYKAHRPPMPEDLREQIEPLHQIIAAMGIPCLVIEGVEADDVIGTLARQAAAAGMDTLISTGDKDMAQLVDEHTRLINTMTHQSLDTQGVVEKFGVRPEQIVDYLALIGDTSDNIPGIPGVGPKTAAKWLREYGSLDEIMRHADEIKGKIGEKLRANLDLIPLSRQLATIKCDVPLEVSPETLRCTEPDQDALRALFQRLEFRRWLEELCKAESEEAQGESTSGKPAQTDPAASYDTVLTEEALQHWLDKVAAADVFAFDTETTSLSPLDAEIVGISLAVQANEGAYIPLAHDYPGAPAQLPREDVLERLRPLLENGQGCVVGQNLKYDIAVLANYDMKLCGRLYDTMLESYVLNSNATRHDMDSLALQYLGRATVHYEDIAGKGKKQLAFNEIALEQAAPYAAEDADVTLQLHYALWPRLASEGGLKKVFENIEMPLMPVLAEIERYGVLVDAGQLETLSRELAVGMEALAEQAYALAGESFNLSSPRQIQAILYDKLRLPVIRKTPGGQPSTAESVLQELALDYPLPRLILEYRSLSKLKSTYTDKLPQQIHPRTGRIHTSYHQAVTATGRLSSSNPNLQNIPVRTANGRRIRQAFIAPPDCVIIAADYSQIELRILAHFSEDPGLLEAFRREQDIHRATAAEIFAVEPEQVTAEQRRHAKAVNFGLIYGMSAFGLSRQLGIERGAAQEYIDLYFARYPGVKRFMDETRERAHEQGYVETLFGRRLHLPEINSRNHQRRQYAERAAINGPMQGTAADIIKIAMLKCQQRSAERGGDLPLRMIMQVHDELVFEAPAGDHARHVQAISSCMTAAAELRVPLRVDIGVGKNWDEAH
ncbi:MAG TPA: DNA polymerase I [Gammaproteobacteria bacterium]|nr:DNA polymerase I [Gammaproteobacteria bacterium]